MEPLDFNPENSKQNNIYYHGSPNTNIVQFECPKNDRPSAFFTKSKKYAAEYTQNLNTDEQTGCIYTVELNFDSPFDLEGPEGAAFRNDRHLKTSNAVVMTDMIYRYLQAHDGVYNNKKYDCIISREDLGPKLLATWGQDAEINYVPLKSDQIKIIDKTFMQEPLHEDTRNQLIAKSRTAGIYKDTSRGKNRFERKKFSKIATQVQSYNQIDMNKFFKQDMLEVTVPVAGETNSYNVVIRLNGVVAEIQRNIKANQNKFEYRTIVQAVTKIFNTTNVYVKCSCFDFRYRFDHFSIINNQGVNDSAHDPGPGKGIANPNNDKGNGCKHILLVLANGAQIMQVSSVLNNYINYMDEHKHDLFMKAIFPKLYGVTADEAAEKGLVPPDFNLETSKDVIDEINKYGRSRGKYMKGSNINPVQADKLSAEQNKKKGK